MIVPVTVNVLSLPAPMPVPAALPAEVIAGVIVGVPVHAPQVTVAVAGTVKTGLVPLLHRYVIAALPTALVAELGSMLLPEPVLVILTTGAAVKNLQTVIIVALTVTVTLSLAWALPDASIPSAATLISARLNFAIFIALPRMFKLEICRDWSQDQMHTLRGLYRN
jgi:hypothetical protein